MLVACGSGASSRPRGSGAGREQGSDGTGVTRTVEAPYAAVSPRVLAPEATFRDVVAAIAALDDGPDESSTAGCVLREGRDGEPHHLEADLSVAVRPVPAPDSDLDGRLGRSARVLTRWGPIGAAHPDLALVALTGTPPASGEAAIVLVVTDEGVYGRVARAAPLDRADFGPASIDQAGARIADLVARPELAAAPIFVTAERGVRVERVARLFEWLARVPSASVALAVALAPGTRLPDAPAQETGPGAATCPDGLPATSDDAPEGDLPADTIRAGIEPLRAASIECLAHAGAGAVRGGVAELAFRIGADGAVQDACFVRDATDDPALRACIVRAALGIRFAAPSPAGTVDVVLPLRLAAEPAPPVRARCD
jgi:hypothetical protein